jgi:hypothetical protein
MENRIFDLGTRENNKIVKIIRIAFGIVCIAIAIFWLIFNISSLITDATLWFTIIFLTGFGFYQVWAGLGRSNIYVEISADHIKLKKNPVLPPVEMSRDEIDKIKLFPLNLIFFLKSKKKIILRFGTTYHDTNEIVVQEIMRFAEINNIPV